MQLSQYHKKLKMRSDLIDIGLPEFMFALSSNSIDIRTYRLYNTEVFYVSRAGWVDVPLLVLHEWEGFGDRFILIGVTLILIHTAGRHIVACGKVVTVVTRHLSTAIPPLATCISADNAGTKAVPNYLILCMH